MSSSINPFDRGTRKPKGKKILAYTLGGILLLGGCGALLDDGSSEELTQQQQTIDKLEKNLSSTKAQLKSEKDNDTILNSKIDDLEEENTRLEDANERVKKDSDTRIKELERLNSEKSNEIEQLKRSNETKSDEAPIEPPQNVAPPVEQQEEIVPAPAPPANAGEILTCKEIGHPTRRGDGLYIPDHDRNGDGVGCESYG